MHHKLVIVLLSFVLMNAPRAQSLYHLQYNFHAPNDTLTYDAFLIRYDNGSGTARIRYKSPVTSQDVMVEMAAEEYTSDSSRSENNNTAILALQQPTFIIGDNNTTFTAPVFIFNLNRQSGYFEPNGVCRSAINAGMEASTTFTAELLQQSSLKRDFMLHYFRKDEALYTDIFKSSSRGDFNLTPTERNIKMYLVIVADTQDSSIGYSCTMDMDRAFQTFDSIRHYIGLRKENFIVKKIAGKNLGKSNVQLALNSLKPAAKDMVVFYYTGHGYRLPENARRFPNIKLKTFHKNRQDVLNNSLNIEDIYNQIKSKGARFNLVLSDCCNDDIYSVNIQGTAPPKSRGSDIEWNDDNVRNLFLNSTPVSILATAAQSGQRASSNDRFGGFFSYYFKTSLENYCSKLKHNVSWDMILNESQKSTTVKANRTYCPEPDNPKNICRQTPDFLIAPEK
ncbi:MAG: caspase family protein [Agriterribacter sp.]